MSGTASRYIGGVPYGPGRSVGRYPGGSNLQGDYGATNYVGAGVRPVVDAGGVAVNPLTGLVSSPSGVAPIGQDNMLLSAALGLAPYAEDAYRLAQRAFGEDQVARPVEQPAGSWGGPMVAPIGIQDAYTSPAVRDLLETWRGNASPETLNSLTPQNETYSPGVNDLLDRFRAGDAASAPTEVGGLALTAGGAADDPLYGILGENLFGTGDLATSGAGRAGGAVGGLISAQSPWTREGYGGVGQQAGSMLGGMAAGAALGSAAGPIGMFFGALGGAFAGGMAGSAAGSQIGPAPTIGANFSANGTFGGNGGISWGGMGGDNGASDADARGFAGQFGQNLLAQAGAQGLQFNPNMAGAQFRIGGYDNFSRGGEAPGGFFYTPGGGNDSPENYALRPNPGMDPYSGQQRDAFTQSVLADLAARDVFTPTGTGRGLDYFGASQGAPLGYYGYTTYSGPGQYSGLDSFGEQLGQRQAEIGGYLAPVAPLVPESPAIVDGVTQTIAPIDGGR